VSQSGMQVAGPIAASVRSTIVSSVPCSSCIPSPPTFTAFSRPAMLLALRPICLC
jgi:hypothetical protein